jgi:diacylglycerol kinase family enzyme
VLDIPLEAVPACQVIATGVPRALDIGEVEGRSFIGIASVGFDSVANKLANEAPARLGELVYLYAALRTLWSWRHATFTLDMDDTSRTLTGWSVAACNSRAYGGGMYAAPGAELDDGLLDVVTNSATGRLGLLRTMSKVFKGTHVELPNIEVIKSATVRIAADRPFTVYADGDPIGELPVTIRAVPHALEVLCPS